MGPGLIWIAFCDHSGESGTPGCCHPGPLGRTWRCLCIGALLERRAVFLERFLYQVTRVRRDYRQAPHLNLKEMVWTYPLLAVGLLVVEGNSNLKDVVNEESVVAGRTEYI